jgi:large subunit ribosomal protein L36
MAGRAAALLEGRRRCFGMKVRNSLKSLKAKDGSYVVRRRGRVFVMNRRNARLKARQG